MEISWSELKTFVIANSLSIQYATAGYNYNLWAGDRQCFIPLDRNLSSDTVDFEDNFKANGNKIAPIQIQPFASKSLPNGKGLFKRFTGISQALSVGSNTFTWTQSVYPWVKFLGIELIGGEIGDKCDLYVLDTATGTYSGYPNYPLNQFAYNANIAPSFYSHKAEYDADMWQNLQIKLVYTSVSAKTIYINFNLNEVK